MTRRLLYVTMLAVVTIQEREWGPTHRERWDPAHQS